MIFVSASIREPALRVAVRFSSVAFCWSLAALPAIAQQQPEDPEDDRKFGIWLDETVSVGLSSNNSLEFDFPQRFDQEAHNLYEYFFQGGIAFRPRTWLTVIPVYRYQRYPGNATTSYEKRAGINLTLGTSRGRWRPNFRMITEGRFPENRVASLRLRFRPGIEYALPLRMRRPPVVVVNNEFFFVPGLNSYPSGGSFTQSRFQAGIRFPMSGSVSIRPYFLLQSVNLPAGWKTSPILGLSFGLKF
jgi:Protein of unknown function (DUF2490)